MVHRPLRPECHLVRLASRPPAVRTRNGPRERHAAAATALDPDARNAALLEAYQIHLDEGPLTIGTVGEDPTPVVVSNKLRNVPTVGLIGSWDMGFPATADPEQFYFAE